MAYSSTASTASTTTATLTTGTVTAASGYWIADRCNANIISVDEEKLRREKMQAYMTVNQDRYKPLVRLPFQQLGRENLVDVLQREFDSWTFKQRVVLGLAN